MRVAFPMLLVNTLDWFAGDQTDLLTTYPTGQRERVPLDGVVGATEAEVTAPTARSRTTPVIDGLATFYGVQRRLLRRSPRRTPTASRWPQIELAANLASPTESDIAPSTRADARRQEARGARGVRDHAQPASCGSYFVAGRDAAASSIEWVTYHRRITV